MLTITKAKTARVNNTSFQSNPPCKVISIIAQTIKTNDKIITNRVMEEMLKVRSVKELEPTYVSSVLRHTTMSSVAKKFISKHDPNVEIALLMSYHTPKKLCESILKVNNEREKPNKKLDILLKLRDIVFNNTEMPNSQRIMNANIYDQNNNGIVDNAENIDAGDF